MNIWYLILIPVITIILFALMDKFAGCFNFSERSGVKISFDEFLTYYTAKPTEWRLFRYSVSYVDKSSWCVPFHESEIQYYFSIKDAYRYRKWNDEKEKSRIYKASIDKLIFLRGRQVHIDISNQTVSEEPYAIIETSFLYGKVEYAKEDLVLIKHKDGTSELLNSNDEQIQNPEHFFGTLPYDTYEAKEYPIYIRNDVLKTDYCIELVKGFAYRDIPPLEEDEN